MKVFERVVLVHFQVLVSNHLDPWQFAYRRKRNVEDAVTSVLNNIYSHLDKPGTVIRLLVFDFSSAFSTIQPHIVSGVGGPTEPLSKLIDHWLKDYVTNLPSYVNDSTHIFFFLWCLTPS